MRWAPCAAGPTRRTPPVRGLERDGLVTRTLFPTIPPRVDYELTRTGKTLLEPLMALAEWAAEHRVAIQGARARYDEEARKAGRA